MELDGLCTLRLPLQRLYAHWLTYELYYSGSKHYHHTFAIPIVSIKKGDYLTAISLPLLNKLIK